MTAPIEKLVQEILEAHQYCTKVVSWYAHSQYDGAHPGKASVRGPFGRWFLVQGGDNGMGDPVNHPTPVADLYDDAKFAAVAMNSVKTLAVVLQEVLNELDRECRCFPDSDKCGACKFVIKLNEMAVK